RFPFELRFRQDRKQEFHIHLDVSIPGEEGAVTLPAENLLRVEQSVHGGIPFRPQICSVIFSRTSFHSSTEKCPCSQSYPIAMPNKHSPAARLLLFSQRGNPQ